MKSNVADRKLLRVLQFGMGWFPEQAGGLNRVYHNLIQHLPSEDVQPHGLVAAQATSVASFPEVHAFADSDAPLLARLRAVRSYTAGLAVNHYDLVASHFALYMLPALAPLSDLPHVVHFHGPWAAEGGAEGASDLVRRVKHWVESSVYHRARRFIVLSEAFRQVLVERYRVSESRVTVVPGGVDVRRFITVTSKREARSQLGWPADRPVVFTVRRLAPRMGLQDLIESVSAARKRVPDVLCLIAGKGKLADELRLLINVAGLDEHVRLLGFLSDEDLPLAYRAADLSVVPTIAWEGFGLVAAESLAAGTPVLVTPVGGLPEVVRALSENLVLPDYGADALAEGVVAALTGALALPDSRACQRFATRYDWPVIAARIADIYREVL